MNQVVVLKFGGTSVADCTAMKRSAQIAREREAKIVLVSATAGTTNQLLELTKISNFENFEDCQEIIQQIKERHFLLAQELQCSEKSIEQIGLYFKNLESLVHGIFLLKECSSKLVDRIVATGELVSSVLFQRAWELEVSNYALRENQGNNQENDKKVVLIDVRHVLKTDDKHTKASPLIKETAQQAKEHFDLENPNVLYVSQGFIGSTLSGVTTTLGRGGSDYSAALIAEAVEAKHLEIWTDVDGIKTTDPRLYPGAKTISELSLKEASELANFGAKVLHPTCLWPSLRCGFPVYVGSTLNSKLPGTWIRDSKEHSNKVKKSQSNQAPLVRAISCKSDQALITISTPIMSQASGFLAKIFNVFKKYEVSIDVVTTSEISVAVTTQESVLEHKEFITELEKLGQVVLEKDLSFISVVGNHINYTPGILRNILNTMEDINIRSVSGGASIHSINFLVSSAKQVDVIEKIHHRFLQ